MKNISFESGRRQWDRFNAFYIDLHGGNFSLFETGELRVNAVSFRPHERGLFHQWGVGVVRPNDGRLLGELGQLQTPDGTPVPKTWLAAGQTFLVDLDTRRMVRLAYPNRITAASRPRHLAEATAYVPGVGATPIADETRGIKLRRPEPSDTVRKWFKQVKALARVQATLLGLQPNIARWESSRFHLRVSPENAREAPEVWLGRQNTQVLANIGAGYVHLQRTTVVVPYLTFSAGHE